MAKRPHNIDAESENRFFSVLYGEPSQNTFIKNVSAGFGLIKEKASEISENISEGALIVAHDLKVGANSATKNITVGAEFVKENISCGKEVIEKQLEEKSSAVITKAQEEYEKKFSKKQKLLALAAELEITKTTLKAAFALLLITAVTFAYYSSAWFVTSGKAEGNDMLFKTEVSSDLIIASSVSELENYTPADSPKVVLFTDTALGMKPARHFIDTDALNHTYPINSSRTEFVTTTDTGLVYNTNPVKVSPEKGYGASDNVLTFEAVPNDASDHNRFFVDYTVYIASTLKSMDVSALTVSIDCSDKSKDYINAGSVDFYLDSVDKANYKGTLNVAGKYFLDPSQSLTEKNLVSPGVTLTIPHNTEGHITVVMRFYFDGGLEKESGQAYVYTEGLTTADFNMTVSFDATEV